MKGKVIGGSVAAVLLAAAALIAPWEGLRTDPYRDIVGVWTVCYGETNVEMRRYTPAECEAMLARSVEKYVKGVAKCIHRPLTVNQWAALGSLTYNIGVRKACQSTLVQQINAGQPASVWCHQLDRWVYAGGKRVRGLERRRAAEKAICLGG